MHFLSGTQGRNGIFMASVILLMCSQDSASNVHHVIKDNFINSLS